MEFFIVLFVIILNTFEIYLIFFY